MTACYAEIMSKSDRKKRPADMNRLAFELVREATGEAPEPEESDAAKRGRLGGLKGGTARAKTLSKKRRSEIAKKAAKARWSRHRVDTD